MSEGPKVVRKKKKWGNVYSYTPQNRETILSAEKAAEIEKDIAKPYVTTATQFAQKHYISVGLAKKILDSSKFTKVFKSNKTVIYQ